MDPEAQPFQQSVATVATAQACPPLGVRPPLRESLNGLDQEPLGLGSDALPLEVCMRELDALLASLGES